MKARSRRGGLSLIELIIAMAILAVAIMALVSSITSSGQIQQATREKTIAYNAARQQIEKMRVYATAEIFSRYNSTTADDGFFPSGLHPGNTFHVPRLGTPTSVPMAATPWSVPTYWSVQVGATTKEPWSSTTVGGVQQKDTFGDLIGNDGVGEITFPESGGNLTETYVDSTMGMPRDLNRDGDSADTNVSLSYKILPVKVSVRWKSMNGKDMYIEVNTFITDK
jgi:prepilin-type N-terminal cleavage/methylation domain-containing protein